MNRPRKLHPRVRPGTTVHRNGTVEILGLQCGSVYHPSGTSVHMCFGAKDEFAPWITGKGPRLVPKQVKKGKT